MCRGKQSNNISVQMRMNLLYRDFTNRMFFGYYTTDTNVAHVFDAFNLTLACEV